MGRRRLPRAIAVACAIGSAGLAYGATGGEGIEYAPRQMAPPLPTPASPNRLPAEPAPDAMMSAISPTLSLAGGAVADALPSGEVVRAVRAVRSDGASYDLVDARRPDGSGYEVNYWRRFAAYELADAELPSHPVAGGTVWTASDDPTLQSLYYLDATGVALRVAHCSGGPGDRVSQADLVAIAERVVRALTRRNGGPPRSEMVGRPAAWP